jgi:hypothetical protein
MYRGGGLLTVALQREWKDGRVSGQIWIDYTTQDKLSKPTRKSWKPVSLGEEPLMGRWTVQYRRGMVRVFREAQRLIQADAGERVLGLQSVFLAQPDGSLRCLTLKLSSVAADARPDQAVIDEVLRLNAESVRLARSLLLDDAAPLAERKVTLCRQSYGEQHELTIEARIMLGLILDQKGDKAAARAQLDAPWRQV